MLHRLSDNEGNVGKSIASSSRVVWYRSGTARAPVNPVNSPDGALAADTALMPLPAGRNMAPPTPVFTKLDPSIVDEELERLAAKATDGE